MASPFKFPSTLVNSSGTKFLALIPKERFFHYSGKEGPTRLNPQLRN